MKRLEIIFKNFILRIFLFFNKVKRSEQVKLNSESKVLLIRLNKIGDALVTTPLIKILKEKTSYQIDILADKKNHFIYKNNSNIKNIIVFEKGIFGFLSTLKKLNSNKYDVVVDLHDDVSTTVTFLISLLKIPNKLGLNKGNSSVYSYLVNKIDTVNNHVIDRNLELLKAFEIDYEKDQVNIDYKINQDDYEEVDSLLEIYKLKEKFLIGINISAGSDARFWGVENYQKIINEIEKYDLNIILLCQKSDVEKAKKINSKLPLFYSSSLDVFSAMISRLDFLISPDTSIIHIASSFEIPVFGLYVKYNTDDMIWSPYKSKFESIITTKPELKAITFEETIKKLKPFLENIYYDETNSRV